MGAPCTRTPLEQLPGRCRGWLVVHAGRQYRLYIVLDECCTVPRNPC